MLAYAAEEAERLSHKHIGTEHLLLGLLREEKCFAAEILQERGLRLPAIREELQRTTQEKPAACSQGGTQTSSRCLRSFARSDAVGPWTSSWTRWWDGTRKWTG